MSAPIRGARLRLWDLLNPAGALTLSRLPLAVVFPFVGAHPPWALAVYLAAVLTDVLDGHVARATGTTSHTGSVLDGWLDKVLHVNVAWTLVVFDQMPAWWMLLWFVRELVQAPMVFWLVGRFVRGDVREYQASLPGKIAAVLLFFATCSVILQAQPLAEALTWGTGVFGLWAALGYLRREHLDGRARAAVDRARGHR